MKPGKHEEYSDPSEEEGNTYKDITRWNWYDSTVIRFPDGSKAQAHRHPNGGGWVADTAYVANSVIVEERGCVFDLAQVYGNVIVKNFAAIHQNSRVFGSTLVGNGNGFHRIANGIVCGELTWNTGNIDIHDCVVFGQLILNDGAELGPRLDVIVGGPPPCFTYGSYIAITGGGQQDSIYPNPPQLYGDSSQELTVGDRVNSWSEGDFPDGI